MSLQVRIIQGDLSVHADFSEPAFELFQNAAVLHQRVFSRLARHGLRLTDMKPEIGSGNLGDVQLPCSLFHLSTSIRIRMERVEIHCFDVNRVDRKRLEELTRDVLEALRAHPAGIPFKTYSVGLALHVMPVGATAKDFLAKFTSASLRALDPRWARERSSITEWTVSA